MLSNPILIEESGDICCDGALDNGLSWGFEMARARLYCVCFLTSAGDKCPSGEIDIPRLLSL